MRSATAITSRVAWPISTIAAGVIVFFAHFRPWEVGLLEEWGFADIWNHRGWSVFVDPSTIELGRPLQGLFVFLSLSTGWGITGLQLMLGLIAVAQYLVVLRFGSRNEAPRRWLFLLVAVLVALHPLWPAGFILRFLGAQVAVLGTLAAIALLYRYLSGGRPWLVALSAVLAAAALLAYQSPAAVLPLFGVALSFLLVDATPLRRVVAVIVMVGAVGGTTIWTTVIAPKLSPHGTYESSLLGNSGSGGPLSTVKTILHSVAHIPVTLAERAPVTVASVVVLAVLVIVLRRRVGVSPRTTFTLAALTVLALVAGVPYAVNPLHVLDPERVGGPASLTVSLVLILWTRLSAPGGVALQTVVVGALLVLGGVATAISLGYWARYSSIQRSMLDLIRPAVTQASGRQRVLIEDGSGVLGDVYTGFYPDLSTASHVYNSDPTNVVMCTADGVVKRHPVAAIYPLLTTKYCSALPVPASAQLVSRGTIAGGPVEVYIISGTEGLN